MSIPLASPLIAQEVYVPPELETWKDWVLEAHPDINCPLNDVTAGRLPCIWMSEIDFRLTKGDQDRLDFRIEGHANAAGYLELPIGDARPVEVEVNRKPARIGLAGDIARVYLDQDPFVVTGRMYFDRAPRTIDIPQGAAIVKLSIDGQNVAVPKIENGKLWLTPQERDRASENSLRLDVYRRLIDGIPQTLETRIRLTADGMDRIESLGKPIFDEFRVVKVTADVPVQLANDGSVRVQVARGIAWITIFATSLRTVDEFKPVANGSHWPASEIWVFESDPQHRTVEVQGALPIDPMLVDSPFGSAPTYQVDIGESLRLTNERRGNPHPKPALFNIMRQIWLAFDGSSLIVADSIAADIQTETRLSADYDLGSVKVDGVKRLVTVLAREPRAESGIALRPSERQIEAVSMLNSRHEIAANGWSVEADSLAIDMHIPPGWKLLWTRGVDSVQGSWASAWWNLWDIFISVLIVAIAYRVGGIPVAGVVFVAILLSFQEYPEPALGWLLLGLLLLLDRQLRSERAKQVVQIFYWALMVPIAVATIYVAASNVRQAVYPQLDDIFSSDQIMGANLSPTASKLIDLSEHDMAFIQSAPARSTVQERKTVVNERLAATKAVDVPQSSTGVAVQTGPGKPDWHWDTARFRWSGPVSKDQRIGLTFLPPPATRLVFALIAVLHLVVLFIFVVAKARESEWIPRWLSKVLPALLLSATAMSTSAAFPEGRLLAELEERLTASPECLPGCASLERATLSMASADKLTLELVYLSAANVAVPLPKTEPYTTLKEATRDGLSQPLLLGESGTMFVQIPKGQTQFRLQYDLNELYDIVLSFPLEPATIAYQICCWVIKEDVDANVHRILLQRQPDHVEMVELAASSYQFQHQVVVQRELDLAFEPSAVTTVRIDNDRSENVSIAIPLLPGETVVSEQIEVQDQHAVINVSPDTSHVSWRSTLSLNDALELVAPTHNRWVELWLVHGSDFWHFESRGVTPSRTTQNATLFKPRVGESLTLHLTRPVPAPGDTVSVKQIRLATSPGIRAMTTSLTLKIDASVVDDVTLNLPPDSSVEVLTLNGEEQPLGVTSTVKLPIAHGENYYTVEWRNETGLTWLYRTPQVTLNRDARNIQLAVTLPRNRWIMLLGGPSIGSAVLFWGVVLVTVLVALTLTFLPKFPLTKLDAVLVAVGATLANIWALIFVVLWIVGIWWRSRSTLALLQQSSYRLVQLGLVLLAVIGILALFITVLNALFTAPDMFIESSPLIGNVSYVSAAAQSLNWFADQSRGELPTAWVISLPFWLYQLAMLAWSLWLVFALSKWVRATFVTLNQPSFWFVNDRDEETRDNLQDADDERNDDTPTIASEEDHSKDTR